MDARVGYALFGEGTFGTGLSALKIDLATGAVSSRTKVTGPVRDYYSHYYGEATRLFPWDALGGRFVFADADLSAKGLTDQVSVFTVDPATGASTAKRVSGCEGYPVGLAWDAAARHLVLGMQTDERATFCGVDPDSGNGTALGSIARGGDETSNARYAAYLSLVDSGVAWRVGHRQVSSGLSPGVGRVTLGGGAGGDVRADWLDATVAARHGMPVSIQRHPHGGYLSLAPKSLGGGLDVVAWDALNRTAHVVAAIKNAHVPSSLGVPLGYVGDAVQGELFAALVVSKGSPLPIPGALDRWAVATVDLDTGAVAQHELSPQPSILGAETIALAGFGVPSPRLQREGNAMVGVEGPAVAANKGAGVVV